MKQSDEVQEMNHQCILGVPEIRAGAEPEGYNLSYSIPFKKFFVSTCVKYVVVKLDDNSICFIEFRYNNIFILSKVFQDAMLTQYTWRRFVVVKIRISKTRQMRFYLTFGFLGFKVVKKRTVNLFNGSEDFGFSNFIWLD